MAGKPQAERPSDRPRPGLSEKPVLRAQTIAPDPVEAVAQLRKALLREDTGLVLLFCAPTYDLKSLESEIVSAFGQVPVAGCTTSGELGPLGYRSEGVAGISFSSRHFDIAAGCLDDLATFDIARGETFAKVLWSQLLGKSPRADDSNSFGVMLIDGMAMREEQVAQALQRGLGDVPLIGGSAGDDLQFGRAFILSDGVFRSDRAACILVSTDLPFRVFKNQHFEVLDERLVVTGADSTRRRVNEINGRPAAQEYARVLGISDPRLTPSDFAAWPVVIMIEGSNYVRSIQKINPDGSLTFYCAIEEGLVFRIGKGTDLLQSLERALQAVESVIGRPQALLTFDCILRKLEIAQTGLFDEVETLLAPRGAVGFNTYGEQYRGVHVNQTFVALAIGEETS
ncbi:FIST domain containing protein [Rhizobium sp. S-51]|uniref:FIST domain containing protein n=1 Tax=Rhizobium terricola TaxID=2728849 RepID=A0A7Y0FXD5_9HYPH|nr:FIST domain containing protein [Rhizobium terricola]